MLTVGQVARLLQVAPKTIRQWIDTHELKGWRVPLSLHRRTTKQNVIDFVHKHSLPLPRKFIEEQLKDQ